MTGKFLFFSLQGIFEALSLTSQKFGGCSLNYLSEKLPETSNKESHSSVG
jgi:hypothetical protein